MVRDGRGARSTWALRDNGLAGGTAAWWVALLLIGIAGCRKKEPETLGPPRPPTVTVTLSQADLKPDGTISAAGMEKLDASAASAENLAVVAARMPLSDGGLAQMAKYPNLRRVDAVGSRVTERGIERLKRKLPQAQVRR